VCILANLTLRTSKSFLFKATAYMMDGSAPAVVWDYQKKVAALLALTESVNNNCPSHCCNRFLFSIYFSNFA
jgi:hypothetical protein